MKRLANSMLLSLSLAGLLLAGTTAKATPLSLTITPAFQPGQFGQLLTFYATVTDIDTSATVYLNSDSTTLSGPLVLDDSAFFTYFPASLSPGGSYTGQLFTVLIPANAPYGLFPGTFEILGGSPSDFTDVVASANFDVNIATPEPPGFVLLLTGLLGVGISAFRGVRNRARIA